MDDDLPASHQLIRYFAGPGPGAHLQRQLRILRIDEPAYAVALLHAIGCVPDRQIQDPATADSRELMAVADQHHECLGLVGKAE